MKDGYPEQKELNLITKWDVEDVFNLLDFIEERWWMPDWGYEKKWGKDHIHNKPVIFLNLHTGGWSGNEDIINNLLRNQMFRMMWYSQWNRGGRYRFEINPYNIGYITASEMANNLKVSRQAIHKGCKAGHYKSIKIGNKLMLFKKIEL